MANNADSSSARRTAVSGESTFSLLERVKAGDAEAVDALFARYVVPLTRWAQGRLPRYARSAADTQDLVQETLLQTFKRIGTFESHHEGRSVLPETRCCLLMSETGLVCTGRSWTAQTFESSQAARLEGWRYRPIAARHSSSPPQCTRYGQCLWTAARLGK
jgi:hypothetical protein